MPTPAVAMLTRSMRADLGIMISASHNPYQDNGIKLFGPDSYKLSDAVEAKISEAVLNHETIPLAPADQIGRARRLEDAPGRYMEFVKSTFPRGARLDGLKVVLDCANGAAYKVAPTVLWELGAEVVQIGVNPDGFNINRECGATSVESLIARVVLEHADIGIALDGDADRVILVDERGQIVDGDQIMGLIASARGPSRNGSTATGWSRRSCPISGSSAISRASASSSPAPRSATAMSSRRCGAPASMSAASSPATSS